MAVFSHKLQAEYLEYGRKRRKAVPVGAFAVLVALVVILSLLWGPR